MNNRYNVATWLLRVLSCSVLGIYHWSAGTAQTTPDSRPFIDGRNYIPIDRTLPATPALTMAVGLGWRSDSEEPVARCVDARGVYGAGYSGAAKFVRVDTAYSLERTLEVSASASAKYSGASASASYHATNSTKFSTDTITIVARQSVVTGVDHLSPDGKNIDESAVPKLTDEALDLLNGSPDAFLKRCGDSYIASVTYGGELVGTLQLTNIKQEDYSSMSAAVGGGVDGGIVGGSASVSANSSVKKSVSNNSLRIETYYTGKDGTETATDLTEFLNKVEKFSPSIQALPLGDRTPIEIRIVRYTRASNWPSTKEMPTKWQNSIALAQESSALQELSVMLEHICCEALASYVPPTMNGNNPAARGKTYYQNLKATVAAELNQVNAERDRCDQNPATCSVAARWRDDYDVRRNLPALISEQQASQQDLRSVVEARYRVISNNFDEFRCADPNKAVRYVCDFIIPEKVRLEAQMRAGIQSSREQLFDARVYRWLESVNNLRCVSTTTEQKQWGCVDSARFAKDRQYMVQQFSPPAVASRVGPKSIPQSAHIGSACGNEDNPCGGPNDIPCCPGLVCITPSPDKPTDVTAHRTAEAAFYWRFVSNVSAWGRRTR